MSEQLDPVHQEVSDNARTRIMEYIARTKLVAAAVITGEVQDNDK